MKEVKSGKTAFEIAHYVVPVGPTFRCQEMFDRFMAEPETMHIPVVSNGKAIGLVNRQDFNLVFTALYGKEIHGRQPIVSLMDPNPMMVASSLTCETLNQLLVSAGRGSTLKGFIVLHGKSYQGVGSVVDVLASIADLMSERAGELEIERKRAEEASISKTNFLASMSHELRTPLNAILGFADLVRKETYGTMEPSRYREYVEDIYQSGDHLLGMINEILDMAKIEAGRFALRETETDPVEIMMRVLRMLRQSIDQAKLEIDVNTAMTPVPMIWADERCLQQVLLNLLSNAIKFTPAGGEISVSVLMNGEGALELQVRDTGIGIPEDKLNTVFEPFEQVENSLTRSRAGTGLGLPLARSMVEAHGGTLTLSSSLGEGTCVCATLPHDRIITPECDDQSDIASVA